MTKPSTKISIFKSYSNDSWGHRFLVWLAALQIASVPICSYSVDMHLLKLPQIIALVLASAWGISKIIRPQFNISLVLISYGLFGIWCGLTLFLHPYSTNYGFIYYFSLLKVVAVSIIISDIIVNLKSFLTILLIFALSLLVIIILNKGNIEDVVSIGESYRRLAGTLGNANILGIYGVTVVWCCLTYWYGSNSIFRYLLLLLSPLAFYLVLLSGSRKAMISIVFLAIFICYFNFRNFQVSIWKKIILLMIGILVLAVVIFMIYHSVFYERLAILWHPNGISSEKSASGRIFLFSNALKIWNEHPLIGIGFEQFRRYFGTYSHSTISETLACTGLIGFLLYFGGLAVLLFKLIIVIKENISIINIRILRSSMVFVLIFIFFNMFAVAYMNKFMWPLIAAIAGYVNSIHSRQTDSIISDVKKL